MRFDFDLGSFSGQPMPIAAPWPVRGFVDEATADWVAVHVAEFFNEFGLCEDVEVVVAALPELRAGALEAPRRFVFEYVQGDGERMELWFTDKKVNVLGHEDISEHVELMAGAKLFQFFEVGGTGAIVVEVG